MLLLADRSVLLIQGVDPGRPGEGRWWLTPGGGVDGRESLEAAAVREVLEETGFRLDAGGLGPVVATRVANFEFDRRQYRQSEYFFAVEVPAFTPRNDGPAPVYTSCNAVVPATMTTTENSPQINPRFCTVFQNALRASAAV